MRYTIITSLLILAASALPIAGGATQTPASPTPDAAANAPAVAAKQDISVSVLDGKITLRLPGDFVDQSRKDAAGQNSGVVVSLYVNKSRSQVVGISEVPTAAGDANDTSDDAFNKMAQGAFSGLKTQFNHVTKTGQTTPVAGGHKFLRIDSKQEMKGEAMMGTILVTPYSARVVTLQILTPESGASGHDLLVKHILDSIAFH
ncbi:hypothetical protein GTU79_00140 [Sodalis ligni]|jgi:hypothetical protein|uniref:Uncharacterized protein n=1 Tax=Sodalis ligni TaxID=2697027 RepID=A0A4R1NKL2_9GAMM|nr:hypothetical protein [Sodalis ligni]QWA11301.1 hypothetical protein GTU79_00140 [Sodalis ligni]TCL05326.1 hypothetical protein EZJ58_3502 [Sodalis ligni]